MKARETVLRQNPCDRARAYRLQLQRRRARYREMAAESARRTTGADRSLARTLAEREMQIAQLTKETAQWRDLALRSRADLENARKRFQREKHDITQFATEQLVRELIPVIDNLERALAAASTATDPKSIHDGVQMLLDQFVGILRANGLELIQPDGQTFDPHFHEAVAAEEREDIADNQILETFQKGYILRGRVVRPAMVRVGRRIQKPAAEEAPAGMPVATGSEETLADFEEAGPAEPTEPEPPASGPSGEGGASGPGT